MLEGRRAFRNEEDARAFILESEACYNTAIDSLVSEILRRPSCRILTLSGPSCSGKTTTANRLDRAMALVDKDVHTISIDDFFYERDVIYKKAAERGEKPDFETVDAVDLDLFMKTVSEIQRGGEVYAPTFDFVTGKRGKPRLFHAEERDVFLFEGIQALYPEIVSIIGKSEMFSIFIEVHDGVSFGDALFLPEELRFLRRLVRDNKYRNAAPNLIYKMWSGVRANEIKNIYPNLSDVDFRMSSTMAYGVNMLRPHLIPLFTELLEDPEYTHLAAQELRRMEDIQPLSASLLPENSVFREFVG